METSFYRVFTQIGRFWGVLQDSWYTRMLVWCCISHVVGAWWCGHTPARLSIVCTSDRPVWARTPVFVVHVSPGATANVVSRMATAYVVCRHCLCSVSCANVVCRVVPLLMWTPVWQVRGGQPRVRAQAHQPHARTGSSGEIQFGFRIWQRKLLHISVLPGMLKHFGGGTKMLVREQAPPTSPTPGLIL